MYIYIYIYNHVASNLSLSWFWVGRVNRTERLCLSMALFLMAFVALSQFVQHASWSKWRINSLRVRRCQSCLSCLQKTVARVRGCLANIAQQPDNNVFFRRSMPICDFKRQHIDWIFIDFSPWLDSGFFPSGRWNMLQPKLLRPWSGRNSKYQVKHFDRRLFHRARNSVPIHMRQLGRQLRRTWRNHNWLHIPSQYKLQCMPCWLVLLLHFWKENINIHFLRNASAITDACRDFLVLCNNSSGMFWVCALECLLSTTIPESQDLVLGPFSKIIGCTKAVCLPGATRTVDLHDSLWWEISWHWVWSCATQIA